jgi:hypothetical protein
VALGALEAHFKVCPLKRGEGWWILVTWDNGRTAQVDGFATQTEAAAWITTNSVAWLNARQTGRHG